MVGLLIGWLAGWLVSRLAGWLVGWVDCLRLPPSQSVPEVLRTRITEYYEFLLMRLQYRDENKV